MQLEQLITIKKQCKLTDMEMARFNQMVLNQGSYPNGRTAKEMRINQVKIENLISSGHMKKTGFCYTNGGKNREDLFTITIDNK